MTPTRARDKVAKLRAHAASVDGTPEAALFYAKANELASQHGLPLTPTTHTTPQPPRPSARVTSTTTAAQPITTPRRTTTMPTTSTTTKPTRPATDGTMRHAFTPRTRAAFGRNSEPGTEVSGHIVTIEEEPDRDFHTKAPKFNEDGTPRMVPILIIQTVGATKPYGPGLRKMWIRSGIADALIGACLDAGTPKPAVGGKVRIRFEGLGEPPARNFAAPKLCSATYEPSIDQEAC
ncbi:DUF2786 domain-containing protein [Nocardia goodfellowii]